MAGGNNANVADAWDEVGVTDQVCNGGGGGGGLHVTVSTNKASYRVNQTVYITINVRNDQNAAVQGATVDVTVTTANGRRYSGSAATAANGAVTFSYRPSNSDGKGTYQVDATANKSGYTSGSGSTTFVVK